MAQPQPLRPPPVPVALTGPGTRPAATAPRLSCYDRLLPEWTPCGSPCARVPLFPLGGPLPHVHTACSQPLAPLRAPVREVPLTGLRARAAGGRTTARVSSGPACSPPGAGGPVGLRGQAGPRVRLLQRLRAVPAAASRRHWAGAQRAPAGDCGLPKRPEQPAWSWGPRTRRRRDGGWRPPRWVAVPAATATQAERGPLVMLEVSVATEKSQGLTVLLPGPMARARHHF